MANRFIDTGFFKSPFVRSLEAPLKLLYSFMICDCDGAGIWIPDFEIASVYLGVKVDGGRAEKIFIDSGKVIKVGEKWFLPDFIEHQYPKGLQENNPAHKNFIETLKLYNLLDGALKPLQRPFEGSKVMVKEEVMVKVMVKEEKEKKQIPVKKEYAPNVLLSEDEFQKIKDYFLNNHQRALEILSNYKISKGVKYKSDYHAMMGWVKDKMITENNKIKQNGQLANSRITEFTKTANELTEYRRQQSESHNSA